MPQIPAGRESSVFRCRSVVRVACRWSTTRATNDQRPGRTTNDQRRTTNGKGGRLPRLDGSSAATGAARFTPTLEMTSQAHGAVRVGRAEETGGVRVRVVTARALDSP